jgi:hypothetical protein
MTTQFNNDRQTDSELSLDELEIVSGGDKNSSSTHSSSSSDSGNSDKLSYLTFTMKDCL